MSEINPAMTTDEWAEFLASGGGDAADENERLMRLNRVRRSMADAALNARRYNAAAAVALHGQRFGFTWDDVDYLRQLVASFRGLGTAPDADGAADNARSLADRIAALLPPREGAGEGDTEAQVEAIVDDMGDDLAGKE